MYEWFQREIFLKYFHLFQNMKVCFFNEASHQSPYECLMIQYLRSKMETCFIQANFNRIIDPFCLIKIIINDKKFIAFKNYLLVIFKKKYLLKNKNFKIRVIFNQRLYCLLLCITYIGMHELNEWTLTIKLFATWRRSLERVKFFIVKSIFKHI